MEIKEALFLVGNLLSILPQVPVLANARGTKGASSNRTRILSFSGLQRKVQNLEKSSFSLLTRRTRKEAQRRNQDIILPVTLYDRKKDNQQKKP